MHIDDLRNGEDMSSNLFGFCGTLISGLLGPAAGTHSRKVPSVRGFADPSDLNCAETNEDGELGAEPSERARLHSLSLVRSCVQKAVGLLRDTSGVASRSMRRIHVLLDLLGDGGGDARARFQEALLARLVQALAKREAAMDAPRDWVSAQARKREALQEGGTLR